MRLQPPLLYLIPRITGSLSLIGSLYIICDLVICDRKQKLNKSSIANRIVLCISISDVFASVSCWILGDWPVPKECNELYHNRNFYGNAVTCTIQGFIYQWSAFSSAFYSAMLAIAYVLLVVGSCRSCCSHPTRRNFFADMSNKAQFSLLAIPLILSLLLAIAPLFDRAYNYNGTSCHIAKASLTCVGDECENGKHHKEFLLANAVCISLCFIIITVSMIVLFCVICRSELKRNSYVFRSSEENWRTNVRSQTNQRNDSLLLSKRVAVQGLFYIGSFFLTWIFAYIVPISAAMPGPLPTWVHFLFLTLLPLQGWFNALNYLRPKIVNYFKEKLQRTETV